ncbi:MAG: beta-lactamase family protein [Acidobacteria bacterium]|nr:beta-lactamase family protein [Acidobacteriota bacterium]
MPRRIRRAMFVVLLVVVFAPQSLLAQGLTVAVPESVGMSSERLERLTAALQGYVDEGRLAGAVAIVARRGKIAYMDAVGYRDVESRTPMTTDAIFRIASQTKALASVGVMLLQEEGRLLITDPVGKYLPEFMETTVAEPDGSGGYNVVPAKRPITIRDLLTHTAGISYGNGPAADRWAEAGITGWYFADRDEPVGDVMARLAGLPLDGHPGEAWIYGYNTDILGAMIEKISGQTLGAFLGERLFGPLGMDDTHFFLPAGKVDRLATVYSATDGGGIERAPDPGHMVGQGAYVDGPRRSFSAGAGLVSTASDYARFLQMMLNGGELDGVRVLSRKTVESMTVGHTGDIPFRPGQSFGLGFSVVEDPAALGLPASVGEFAWGGAYHSTYWVDPAEELVVAYMTQIIPAGDIDDHGKLRALVHQAIID